MLELEYGARAARALYCSVDPDLYFPEAREPRWYLGYLGTYSADRQPALQALLLAPACMLPQKEFLVAGPQYPSGILWPTNVKRLKHLPPRPPFKSSGMEKATQPRPAGPGRRPGRGAKRDRVTREVTIPVEVPPGSRFKGYKTVVRRDLVLVAEVVRYRRERWVTPEGQTLIAPLPVGVTGGFGPGVRRFCLAPHTQGQVTTERLTDLLNGTSACRSPSARWCACSRRIWRCSNRKTARSCRRA